MIVSGDLGGEFESGVSLLAGESEGRWSVYQDGEHHQLAHDHHHDGAQETSRALVTSESADTNTHTNGTATLEIGKRRRVVGILVSLLLKRFDV